MSNIFRRKSSVLIICWSSPRLLWFEGRGAVHGHVAVALLESVELPEAHKAHGVVDDQVIGFYREL